MEMVQWNKGYNSLDAHSKITERIGDKNMVKESLKKNIAGYAGFCRR